METVETTDITYAAFLRVSGYTMVRIKKVGDKGTFYFVDVPPETIDQYNLGQARIEPVSFHEAIRALTTAVRRTSSS